MPEFIVNALPGAFIALVSLLLGVVAYRRFNTKQLGEIQQQVNTAYQVLNAAQKEEIAQVKREMVRCKEIMTAIRIAVRQMGVEIEIDGDAVTLIKSETPTRTRVTQVQIKEEVKNDMKKQEDT